MNLRPTVRRQRAFADHMPPKAGRIDADGKLWHGHSRCTDTPARQRHNARTWAALKAARRAAYVAQKREAS